MTRHMLRSLSAAAAIAVLVATTSGCAADPSYTSLDDASMMKLFPTEAEVKTALGGINTLDGPRSHVNKPSSSPQPSNGLSPEC